MNTVEIKISGPGGTFGSIALEIKRILEELGANITIDENYDNVDLPFDKYKPDLSEFKVIQTKNRDIHIHLEHIPWGG